ncbi:hypothetical protein [Azospirillum sp. TSH64]|uniref:hypothetical protein n=1 Tax=Azospirillum sp. TSH64 TaxID=652740 RepID=UPI001304FD1B|nr:hypothetical protein [Azospirillum sp. TSH64]
MFDFDVVTGPTQPPHCHLADEAAGPAASESVLPPANLIGAAAATLAEPHTANGEKPRS